MTIRVVLADDQALVRGALAALLSLEDGIEVVGQAGCGEELVALVEKTAPDVVLVDIEMPGMDGFEATRQISAAWPEIKCLVVTTFGRPGYLQRALEAGASGFVVKETPADQLANMVRDVHAGKRVIDPALATESLFPGRTRSPFASARSCASRSRAGRWPTSPGVCTCRKGRCATISPAQSGRWG